MDIKECEHVIDIHEKILNSAIKDLNQTKLSNILFSTTIPQYMTQYHLQHLISGQNLEKILEKLGQDKLALQQGRADRGVKIL